MSNLSQQTWSFPGGLRLDGHKHVSTSKAIAHMPLVAEYVLPLSQHIGQAAVPCVAVGDKVRKGQRIADAAGYVSVPLHAPTSGSITAIEPRPVPHPSGLKAMCIVLKADGEDHWCEHKPVENVDELDPSALRNMIREAGIVGLGGAGFPSFIKLNAGPDAVIETLILNGIECEPWISCDDMLMRERAEKVIAGLQIMAHVLQAQHCLVGIEDNKPEAIDAMRLAVAGTNIKIVVVPTRYPAGSEKQLVYTLTGQKVPSHGLPVDIGVVCHNVGTAVAVNDAIAHGRPLLSRIVTVTGPAVPQPRNYEVLLGTPMKDVLAHCAVDQASLGKLIMGGPMMGFTLHSSEAPIIKTCNCLLLERQQDVMPTPAAAPCVRCGLCADVCPVKLLPQQLYWHTRARDFEKSEDYNLFDCIECGCCAHVCPCNIPLVQYYRFAKTEIGQQQHDREKSDQARERHEFREARLVREKRERAEKHKQRAQELKPAPGKQSTEDAKKAVIMAALERAKQKKAAAKNVDNLTPEQQAKIDEVDARRAQLAEQQKDKDKA
jgi:electron transport complex protein RnfC